MSLPRLIVLGLLGLAAGCTTQRSTVPPFFEKTTAEALAGKETCGIIVTPYFEFKSDEIPGLEGGERLLAVDGYRVYDGREFQLFRQQHGLEVDAFALLVGRERPVFPGPVADTAPAYLRRTVSVERQVVPLQVANTLALRRIGNGMRMKSLTLPTVLKNADQPCGDEESRVLIHFPQRAVYEIADWVVADPANVQQLAWLRDLMTLYVHLANQEWEQAAALAAVPPPLPYCRRLARFYHSLAERNRHGEQPPDPAAHGEDLDFYVINYPYPKFIWPPKGDLASSDAEFLEHLNLRYRDPFGSGREMADWAMNQLNKYTPGSERQCYLGEMKAALVYPACYGGWPFRSTLVCDAKIRNILVPKLRDGLAKKDADEQLYTYALIGPLVIDKQEAELKERLGQLGKRSPFFCLLAVDTALSAAMCEKNQPLQQQLREWWLKEQPAGTPAGKPSAWLDYVKMRSRYLSQLTEFGTEEEALQSLREAAYARPFDVWCALRRPVPVAEAERALDQALAAPDWTAHRRELLQQIVTIATPDVTLADYARLEQLVRDQTGYGLYLEGLNALLFWKSQPPKHEPWIFAAGRLLTVDLDDTSYPAMCKALDQLDWSSPTVEAQAQNLFERLGRPAAALRLADALNAHGHDELANRIRGHVLRFYRLFTEYQRAVFYGQDSEFSLRFATIALARSPATSEAAIGYGKRFLAVNPQENRRDGVYLDLTLAALQLGRLSDATNYLIESFDNQNRYDTVYYYDGRVDRSATAFRAWLWRQLTTHKEFTPELRQRLTQAIPPEKVRAMATTEPAR